jgi:type IV pilus assembly protein PilV
MIEVLVAIVVLALGLLGFALLQTMNLRYTQSANYRTQATNLAYDLLDQMRANRFPAVYYSGASGADFAPGDVTTEDCDDVSRPTGAVTIADNIERWQCQVVRTLGDSAAATVTYVDGITEVTISWSDDRNDPDQRASFELETRL